MVRLQGPDCIRAELVVDLLRDGCSIRGGKAMFFAQEPAQEKPAAQRVYPPRNACRQRMDDVETSCLELRIPLPSNMLEPMLDICLGFVLVDRAETLERAYAMLQLLAPRT